MDEGLIKIRHARSKKDFPFLKLEEDEYVEFSFKRAKICLVLMMSAFAAGLVAVLIGFLVVMFNQGILDEMGRNFLNIILTTLAAATILAAIIALRVFRGNRIIITNKHVVQFTMISPVVNSMNMIDLPSIEDASFRQGGLIQKLLHYGTFRLSTVGDETTYTFPYSDITPGELRAVSKLITDAKKKQKQGSDDK